MAGLTSSSPSMITNPATNINQGEQGMASGAVTGAAAGATAGSMILPGIGTVVGGVIGGIIGGISGAFADKGKVYERKANKWARLGKTREAAVQVRDAVDSFRQQRAMQMAAIGSETGGTLSSAPAGAVSSFGSQYAFGLNFNQGQMYIAGKVEKNLKKAGKAFNNSKLGFSYLNAATSIAGAFGGGGFGSTTTQPSFGVSNVNNYAVNTPQADFGFLNTQRPGSI